MKKTILILCVLFVSVFSAVNAQDSENELSVLNAAHLFSWSDTLDDVKEILSLFPEVAVGDVEESASRKTLIAVCEDEAGRDKYSFYFDAKSEKLLQLDVLGILYEDQSMEEVLSIVSTYYGMDEAGPYENAELEEIGESFELYQVTAGPKTACMIGVIEPTEEKYGMIGIVFVDREYLESF